MTKINVEETCKEPRVNLQQGDLIMLIEHEWFIIARDSYKDEYKFVGLSTGALHGGLRGDSPVDLIIEYFSFNYEFELIQGLNYFSKDTLEITLKEVGGNEHAE